MRSRQIMPLLVVSAAVIVHAQEPASEPTTASAPVRFTAVNVYLDSQDQPLAAYQFELTVTAGDAAIVGVEGGDHAAFKDPPYYDPMALSRNRIIIAAFNTGRDLPTGRTRIARLHMQVTGNTEPKYQLRLDVAASAQGQSIPASMSLLQGEHE